MTEIPAELLRDLDKHLQSRQLRESAQGMEDNFKNRLKESLKEVGELDSKGSYHLDMGGVEVAGKSIDSLKLEKRVPITLDPVKVSELVPTPLRSEVFRYRYSFSVNKPVDTPSQLDSWPLDIMVDEEIDEDALLALNYDGKLSDDLLKQMYVEGKVVWAFKVNYR